MSKKRLGKGLDALIPELKEDSEEESKGSEMLSTEQIEPNPHQPRKNYSENALEELANSIKAHGVIQPIIVTDQGDKYLIVAGERRYRAAKRAGLDAIPAIVKDISETQMMQLALLENIQREDLNPIDKGEALKKLVDNYGLTQNQLSTELGIARSSLTNVLRILQLEDEVQEIVREGRLSEGHARTLLSLKGKLQLDTAKKIVERQLSVRETEKLVKQIAEGEQKQSNTKSKDPFISELEEKLTHNLGTKVKINQGKKKGKIEIEFMDNDDLERVISQLSNNN